ncbi:hypothetical protein ACWCO0_22840 [Streptomyces tubercidicus]
MVEVPQWDADERAGWGGPGSGREGRAGRLTAEGRRTDGGRLTAEDGGGRRTADGGRPKAEG